ncbi:MAG: radical SAM protein [Actinobacteria bacterium]|nr:radical SAM protein [Actinomycetota bacterium]
MLEHNRVFVGSVCSNECKHCPHETRQNRQLSEIEADLSAGSGKHGVEIYGGEPLERFDFSRLVASAKALNRLIKVVTNGRALSRWETVKSAIEAGVSGFEVKLWGANQALHDELTGRDGSFFEAVQGISNARGSNAKIYLAIRALTCRENIDSLADIARIAATFRVDRLVIEPIDPELSLVEASRSIKLAIETAITNRVWAMTERMPLCTMSGYEPHVSEALLPKPEGLVKVSACGQCVYTDVCDGVADASAERFQVEVKPAKDSAFLDDLRAIRDERKAKSLTYKL